MPRKASISEQQPEENSEGALRRSSRIAQNSPAPAKIPQRRNSASSNDTPAKIKTKRLSLSQESNGSSTDSKPLPDTNKTNTPRKNRSTRSASKSPTSIAMNQETKAAVPKTRGRRGSLSKTTEEEVIDSPAPVNSRRRSLRSESKSPTNAKDVEQAKPKTRRGSITEKVTQLDPIEEGEQSAAHPKKRYKGRRPSLTEMSQLDVIEETEVEKKDPKKDLESISEAGENDVKEKLSKSNETESGDDGTSNNDEKEDKLNLTPVVRLEKSKTIANLSINQESKDAKIKSTISKSEETLNVEAARKTENEVDNINRLDSNIGEELSTNSEEGLQEKENKTTDASPSVITTANNEDDKTSPRSEVPDRASKSDPPIPTAKLAAEDEIIVKDIDKLLGVDNDNKKSTISGNKEIKIDVLDNTTDLQSKNDKDSDENCYIEAALIPSTESPTGKIVPEINTDKEIESKAASPVNLANKSLTKLLPNQLNMSLGSDGSFNLNLSIDKIEGCDSQEEISTVSRDESTAETEVLDKSGSFDKENTESNATVSEASPKPKISKESKSPLSNISLNDMENKAILEKVSLLDDSCEPMDVDDPPLTHTEIAPNTKEESTTNEVKSSTPSKKVRKSIHFDIPKKESEVLSGTGQNEDINENATDNAIIENLSEMENKSTANEGNNLEDDKDKEKTKEDFAFKDLNTSNPANQTSENIKLGEDKCTNPTFKIHARNSDKKENDFPEKAQGTSEESILQDKTNPASDSNENKNISRQHENNTIETENAKEQTTAEVIAISDEEKDSFSLSEYTLSKSLTTPESLNDVYLAQALPKGLNTSVNITPVAPKRDSSQITQNNSGVETSLSSPSEGVCSPKLVEVDVHVNHKENTNKVKESHEQSAENESDLVSYMEKEPVASTSKAVSDISVVYSPEKADSPQNVISTNNEIVEENENKSSSDDHNTVAAKEIGEGALEKELFAAKDSSTENCEKEDTLPVYSLAVQNTGLPTEANYPANVETEGDNKKSDDSNSVKTVTQPLTVNKGLTDKADDEGCSSKKPYGNSHTIHVESAVNKETNENDAIGQKQHKSKLQIHSVIELKNQDSPKKTKKGKTLEMDEKNESPKIKHLKKSNHKGGALEELDDKVTELIEDALKEVASNSDSEDINEFIDDMADEGEEDTPSEGSNDIPCEGESINSSDTYTEDEDDYENDSFIDDEEEKHELLSGEEDFLQKKTAQTEKVTKFTHKKDLLSDKTSKKRKRIITPSESEDDYQQKVVEENLIQDLNSTKDAKSSEEDSQIETGGNKPAETEKESLISEEEKVTQIDETAENLTNIPTDLTPSKSDIVLIDSDSDSEVSGSKDDSIKKTMNNSATEKKSKRKSSITIQENIKLEDIEDGELSARISKVVDWFCTGIKGRKCDTGNISLNVSLDYADQSSVDDNLEKDHDAKDNNEADGIHKNDESVEEESIKKVIIEEVTDDVFVDTISGPEQSPKIQKKPKRKLPQKPLYVEDNGEIPTLIELSDSDKKHKYSSKLKGKSGEFGSGDVKLKGKRSTEPIQHLSPKKHRLEAGFEVENIVIDKAGKKSKEIKSKRGKHAMKENIEHPQAADYLGAKSKKKTKRQREQEENNFETSSKQIKKKGTLKSVQTEFNAESIAAQSSHVKGKKEATDSDTMLRFMPSTYNTKKKKIAFNKEFDVETLDKQLGKKEKYLYGKKETANIPCPSGSLRQHVLSNASVSKTELDKGTERSKKLKRNVSQKLLPTRNIGSNDSWDSEVFDVSLHPSISNKKMDDIGASKKKKTESLFSSKDFKNRMLYDSSRVKRMDTKTLLRHRKNV